MNFFEICVFSMTLFATGFVGGYVFCSIYFHKNGWLK